MWKTSKWQDCDEISFREYGQKYKQTDEDGPLCHQHKKASV